MRMFHQQTRWFFFVSRLVGYWSQLTDMFRRVLQPPGRTHMKHMKTPFILWVKARVNHQLCSTAMSAVRTQPHRDSEFIQRSMGIQDPKMEVLYHIRPYFVGIVPYIGLKYRPYISLVPPMNWFLKWPLKRDASWHPQVLSDGATWRNLHLLPYLDVHLLARI